MIIGYCPTMESFVSEFNRENKFVTINLGSAKQVLNSLNNDEIDLGIIGRIAKTSEFNGFVERLGSGYTLVTNSKQMILNEGLKNLTIHTMKSYIIDKLILSMFKQIVYHEKIPNKINDQSIWLIDWDDWNDNFELLIPVDFNYNKNPLFRVPHLYSKRGKFW